MRRSNLENIGWGEPEAPRHPGEIATAAARPRDDKTMAPRKEDGLDLRNVIARRPLLADAAISQPWLGLR